MKIRNKMSKGLIFGSLVFQLFGYRTGNPVTQVYSSFLLYLGIIVCLSKHDLLFGVFISLFFLFLQARPLIDMFDHFAWYKSLSKLDVSHGLMILYISFFMLYLGYNYLRITEIEYKNRIFLKKENRLIKNINYNKFLVLAILVFFISYLSNIYGEIHKFLFMKGKLYEEYYLGTEISLPIIIKVFSGLYLYSFILLLSLKPKKIYAYLLYILHISISIPTLLIGQRGSFVIALLFIIIYHLMRYLYFKEENWISRREIMLAIVSAPLLLILLSYINEGRHGNTFAFRGLVTTFKTFLHKQGVTFDAYMQGIKYQNIITNLSGGKNYLFGELIEFVKYNPISLKLFNVNPLPSGNNIVRAVNGNSYAHIMSLLSHHSYLKGFGFGTSYVLEALQTYGILGVVLVNLFLGKFIKVLQNSFNKGTLERFISLLFISKVIYLPRQAFSTLILVFFHPYFIVFVILLLIILKISSERKLLTNESHSKRKL